MRRALASCFTLAALLVSGCTPAADPDQARLCRIALAAGLDQPRSVVISRQTALRPNDTGSGVRVDYTAAAAGEASHARFAECRFAIGTVSASPESLAGFRSDQGELTPASLYFLKRFWLGTAEAQSADPQPVAGLSQAPPIPPTVAHALQNVLNALPALATYAMLSAAYSLVYGLVNRINLAFGEIAAVGGAAALAGAGFLTRPSGSVLLTVCVAAAIWATTVHGAVIARVVFQPLRHATGQQGLVATIGLALALHEYLRLAQGSAPPWMPPLSTAPIAVARSGSFVVTVTPLSLEVTGVFALTALAVLVLMARSQFGRDWRALADDPQAAALLGVAADRVFAQTFALASGLAGLAGAVVVLVYGSFGASYSTVIGLKGLLGAVIGGIGSVPGAFTGGIVIGALEALWSAFFPIEYRDLALFSLLVCTLVAWPGGFLGYRELGPRPV